MPELLDEPLAGVLSACCIETLTENVEKYFTDLRYLSTKLSSESRISVLKDLVTSVLQPRKSQWVQILGKIAEDLNTDKALSADSDLVETLDDYAFEAARVSPDEAAKILVALLPHLGEELLKQNLEESEDRLLALEGAGSAVSQMEPYLALLKASATAFKNSLPQKLVTFSLRMLGSAKTDDEKKTVLHFLSDAELAQTDRSILERIAELAAADGPVAEAARLISTSAATAESSGEKP
jgi:hypothetical protein